MRKFYKKSRSIAVAEMESQFHFRWVDWKWEAVALFSRFMLSCLVQGLVSPSLPPLLKCLQSFKFVSPILGHRHAFINIFLFTARQNISQRSGYYIKVISTKFLTVFFLKISLNLFLLKFHNCHVLQGLCRGSLAANSPLWGFALRGKENESRKKIITRKS